MNQPMMIQTGGGTVERVREFDPPWHDAVAGLGVGVGVVVQAGVGVVVQAGVRVAAQVGAAV